MSEVKSTEKRYTGKRDRPPPRVGPLPPPPPPQPSKEGKTAVPQQRSLSILEGVPPAPPKDPELDDIYDMPALELVPPAPQKYVLHGVTFTPGDGRTRIDSNGRVIIVPTKAEHNAMIQHMRQFMEAEAKKKVGPVSGCELRMSEVRP